MMSRPLLFVGEGFFPYARLPSFAGLAGWRALLGSSTVPFSSLARLARGPVASPLFGVSIHRTASSTRAALCPPAGLRHQGRGRAPLLLVGDRYGGFCGFLSGFERWLLPLPRSEERRVG